MSHRKTRGCLCSVLFGRAIHAAYFSDRNSLALFLQKHRTFSWCSEIRIRDIWLLWIIGLITTPIELTVICLYKGTCIGFKFMIRLARVTRFELYWRRWPTHHVLLLKVIVIIIAPNFIIWLALIVVLMLVLLLLSSRLIKWGFTISHTFVGIDINRTTDTIVSSFVSQVCRTATAIYLTTRLLLCHIQKTFFLLGTIGNLAGIWIWILTILLAA